MEALEAILTRRSIRKYSKEKVPDEKIHKLLEAAMSAPSANNYQPWHFIVINDKKIFDQIPKFHPYSKMIKNASVAIAVCGDKKLEKNNDYLVQDCSAATENILLAAHALGLGAVWLGIYPRKERLSNLKKHLNIPDDILPISLISIGYPAEQNPPAERFNPDRIHNNLW